MKLKTAAGVAFVLSGVCAIAASALDREVPGTGGTTFGAIGAGMNNGVSFVPSGAFTAQSPSFGIPGGSFTSIGESYTRGTIVPASPVMATPATAPLAVPVGVQAPAPVPGLAVESKKTTRSPKHRAYQTGTYSEAHRHLIELIADSYIAYCDRRAREPVTPHYDASVVRKERARRAESSSTRRAYQN